MSRRSRFALIAGASVLALIALAAVIGVWLVQSAWFREQVGQRVVAEAEKATGGRVEIGSFDFDWHTLTVQLNNFVIHGLEPAGSPPLLSIGQITARLKIISILERAVDVRSIDAERPEAHLIVNPDGTTNVPQPKLWASTKNPVATILDLAIGQFNIRDGMFQVNSSRTPWNAAGENLRVQLTYNRRPRSYHGEISVQPLHFIAAKDLPVDMSVKVSLAVEKNKLTISSARLETPRSEADLSGAIDDFSSPEYRLQYTARVSLDELLRTLRFRTRPEGILEVKGNASFRDFSHYLLTGNLAGGPLAFGQGPIHIQGVRARAAFRVDPERMDLTAIHLMVLDGKFDGRARIEKLDQIHLEGEAADFALQRIAETFRLGHLPWDGLLSGPVEMTGMLSEFNQGRFRTHAQLVISPAAERAPMHGLIDATYDGYRGAVDLAHSFLQLPSTRIDLMGVLGRQLQLRLQSTNLEDLTPALEILSHTPRQVLPVRLQNGSAVFNGTVTGPLSSPDIAGHVTLRSFVHSQEKIDSLAGEVKLNESGLRVRNASLARGALHSQFSGAVGLHDWRPEAASTIAATASVRDGDVRDLLALAQKPNWPIAGSLSATAEISGSFGSPRVVADTTLIHGSLYGEPFDRFIAHVTYENHKATVQNAQAVAGPSQLNLSASYAQVPSHLENGSLAFEVSSNRLPLNQFQWAHEHRLTGGIQFTAKGSADVSSVGPEPFRLTDLNANLDGQDIQIAQRPVGAVHLVASTQGSMLVAHAQSSNT